MRGRGFALAALLVGCATGAIARDVILPARAAGNGASYSYKIYRNGELEKIGRAKNAELNDMDALQAGLNEVGQAGWRLVQFDAHAIDYYFESAGGGGAGR